MSPLYVPDANGLPLPRPPMPVLAHAFDIVAILDAPVQHGRTPLGGRARVPILSGSVDGPDIKGRIVPGGNDWQLVRGDGYITLEANYYIETNDGVSIHIANSGLLHIPTQSEPFVYAFTTPRFEAPMGRYGWLNQHIFAGTVVPDDPVTTSFVQLSFYRLI